MHRSPTWNRVTKRGFRTTTLVFSATPPPGMRSLSSAPAPVYPTRTTTLGGGHPYLNNLSWFPDGGAKDRPTRDVGTCTSISSSSSPLGPVGASRVPRGPASQGYTQRTGWTGGGRKIALLSLLVAVLVLGVGLAVGLAYWLYTRDQVPVFKGLESLEGLDEKPSANVEQLLQSDLSSLNNGDLIVRNSSTLNQDGPSWAPEGGHLVVPQLHMRVSFMQTQNPAGNAKGPHHDDHQSRDAKGPRPFPDPAGQPNRRSFNGDPEGQLSSVRAGLTEGPPNHNQEFLTTAGSTVIGDFSPEDALGTDTPPAERDDPRVIEGRSIDDGATENVQAFAEFEEEVSTTTEDVVTVSDENGGGDVTMDPLLLALEDQTTMVSEIDLDGKVVNDEGLSLGQSPNQGHDDDGEEVFIIYASPAPSFDRDDEYLVGSAMVSPGPVQSPTSIQTFTIGQGGGGLNIPVAGIADKDAALHGSVTDQVFQQHLPKDRDSQWSLGVGAHKDLVTRTVAGFDDFVTTVDDTVIIFTPDVNAPAMSLKVTPTKVIPGPSLSFDSPSMGIESLFHDFKRPPQSPEILLDEDRRTLADSIKPSAVQRIKVSQTEDDTRSTNDQGLLDKLSAEPVFQASDDGYYLIDSSSYDLAQTTITRVASTTLLSNFVGKQEGQVGLITGTGGTLISNGITTVHTARVFGTYLSHHNYAQIIQSTAKVFEEDRMATSASWLGFPGSIQYVTDLPTFGLEASSAAIVTDGDQPHVQQPWIAAPGPSEKNGLNLKAASTSSLLMRPEEKQDALNHFKNRLKNRFQKFKDQLKQEASSNVGRGSITQIDPESIFNSGNAIPNSRDNRSRFPSSPHSRMGKKLTEDQDLGAEPDVTESTSSEGLMKETRTGRSRSLSPYSSRLTSSRFGSRSRNSAQQLGPDRFNSGDQLQGASGNVGTNGTVGSHYLTGEGLGLRDEASKELREAKFDAKDPKVNFKKFGRFNRPGIRKVLLERVFHKHGNDSLNDEGTTSDPGSSPGQPDVPEQEQLTIKELATQQEENSELDTSTPSMDK